MCLAVTMGAAPLTIFQVSTFSDLEYPAGFSGVVGETAAWPSGMGRSGDTVHLGFNVPEDASGVARAYRFRAVVWDHVGQSFPVSVAAGPSLDALTQVHTEFVDSARVLAVTIPVDRFVAGQTNWIRLRGSGVQVGGDAAEGIRWTRWLLTRTDVGMTKEAAIDDQFDRLGAYVRAAIQPGGLVRDSLTLSPSTPPFHPASPDAAGFALLALCGLEAVGRAPDAGALVERILSAHAGRTPGITPARNARGHWWHWMNLNTGAPAPGWVDNYTSIGSALLVSGGLFARNHFPGNTNIAALAAELQATCDFDGMIHPELDGRVALATDAAGDAVGYVRPWNEYMLVVSLALRQPGAVRAQAVAPFWLDPDRAPKAAYRGNDTLTDREGFFAPAFWVQQQFYFNPDYAASEGFVRLFWNHQRADALYCAGVLRQNYRHGLTAGVVPSGYRADRIQDHENVFSPSAVGGWADVDGLMEFLQDQPPEGDVRNRYGMRRVSSRNAAWVPADAGLVDHLFLLFGLVEARRPGFHRQRLDFGSIVERPALRVVPESDGQASLSWSPELPGFVLQAADMLMPDRWTNLTGSVEPPVTISLSGPARFFRLHRP